MALIDASRNQYFELAKERWQAQGFDADITDILEKYKQIEHDKFVRDGLFEISKVEEIVEKRVLFNGANIRLVQIAKDSKQAVSGLQNLVMVKSQS